MRPRLAVGSIFSRLTFAEHLDDRVDAAPAGLCHEIYLLVTSSRMIEDLRARLARAELSAFGTGRARFLRAIPAAPPCWCRSDADGTACAIDSTVSPGPHALYRRAPTPCGDIRDAEAGPFGKRDMAEEMMNLIDRAHDALSVHAHRLDRRCVPMTYTRSPTLTPGASLPTATTAPARVPSPAYTAADGTENASCPVRMYVSTRSERGGLDINHHLARVCKPVWHLFQFHDGRNRRSSRPRIAS